LGMIGMIVLFARLLNVPLFFWMLQSLVPYCPGAMCVYGVVNVGSPYSVLSLVMKLILPFIYGLWIVFEFVNRRQPVLPFMRKLARSFLLVLVPLVLIDSSVDVLLVASIRPVYAPCCSSVYDVDPPFSPSAILGPQVGILIVILTLVLAITLIAIQWLMDRSKHVPIVTLVLSIVVALLYLVTLHDTLAPLVLGLPNHHCPYCLFQEFPDTAFFAGLFWIGIASGGWRAVLETVKKQDPNRMEQSGNISQYLLKISSVCLLFSMVSLVSHILVAL
ncbi:MAG: hypothetical protein PVJ05_13355, partial [Candidatus Thorarchaeota archaeon]